MAARYICAGYLVILAPGSSSWQWSAVALAEGEKGDTNN